MFRNSHTSRGSYAHTGNPAPRWRMPLIALVLVLMIGSVGQAHAAPMSQQDIITNVRYYLRVVNPGTLCVGGSYPLRVTPLTELDGKTSDGQRFNYKDRIIPGITIKAEVQDSSIAAISPVNQKSGSLPRSFMETFTIADQEKLGRLGEVVFTLYAKKAGTTNLYLTAEVPKQWTGATQKYFGAGGMPVGGPIKVVNCDYKLTVIYDLHLSFGGATMWGNGVMRNARLKLDGETLKGSGEMSFAVGGTGDPHCLVSLNWGASPVTMTGTFDENSSGQRYVTINFEYGSNTQSGTNVCPFGSGSVSSSEPPPPSAIKSLIFSDEGETIVVKTPQAGSVTFTLVPIPVEGNQ